MDGNRDSAVGLLEALNKQELRAYKAKFQRNTISKLSERKIIQANEHNVYQRILMKYKIMVVRAKISYIACQKSLTIKELIVKAILRSYEQLEAEGYIKVSSQEKIKNDELFNSLIKGENGILRKIVKNNGEKVQLSGSVWQKLDELRHYKP